MSMARNRDILGGKGEKLRKVKKADAVDHVYRSGIKKIKHIICVTD
jgi:hypothetical protein